MENNIIDLKEKELKSIFKDNIPNFGLIISMLSLERLWLPFTFATSKRVCEIQEKVRICMEMMWDRAFEVVFTEGKKEIFVELLDSITEQYSEDDSQNIRYNYCFDNYLVNALYSNIGYFFVNPMSNEFRIRTSATLAVLEMLSDYVVDDNNLKDEDAFQKAIKQEPLILSEIDRINQDIVYLQKNYSNMEKIVQLKNYYMNLEILPIKTLKLIEFE